ncbi:MAG TPA: Trk system potassium transporter TrkA [Methanofastidiosum sp.]|nr:Trk system potassium transporter TrkA [Methanofastidiosum sp.]HPA49205.1 Trk system potassium transporter TrkA [Methanofastidiosum sp.]HQK62277.1 Trk system potassium transporter TrkA [Methanofastidiosum sp.]HQM94766.1 Trk system potassium transporter TrkA [Methanofastidiosum sp.]HQQ48504.1 Trk system potassium transporter TrkA [Methanofastidiosum sp.]
MYVIVVGGGLTGYNIAKLLVEEGIGVVVIEKDLSRCQEISKKIDALVIQGNGANPKILNEAGAKDADLLVAVTNSSEVNLISCISGKNLGVKKTVAKIAIEYTFTDDIELSKVGVDYAFSPGTIIAYDVERILELPSALAIQALADGKVTMAEFKVGEDSKYLGKALKEKIFPDETIIGAVIKEDDTVIPTGEYVFEEGDKAFILGKPKIVEKVIEKCSECQRIRKVMIMGASNTAVQLAKMLERSMSVKLIDSDAARCEEISKILQKTLVIKGDIMDLALLKDEGIGDVDAFVSLTRYDQLNLFSCLLAKYLGTSKTIARVENIELIKFFEDMGVDVAISPKISTAEHVMRFIRMGGLRSLIRLPNGQAEVIELSPTKNAKIMNKPLKEINLPEDLLFLIIVRDNKLIIPRGNDVILEDDKVIISARVEKIKKIKELFGQY